MSTITFDSIKPSAGNRLVVTGTFPAGLVRGVKEFQFELTPTLYTSGVSSLDFTNVSVNGVRLKGYLHLAPLGFRSPIGARVGSLSRLGSWDNPSSAAYNSMASVGALIKDAMVSDDLVAQAAVMNTKVAEMTNNARLDEKIKRAEQELSELRALRASQPSLDGIHINGAGLKLAITLIADGISYDEALSAAVAIGK